MAVANPCFNIYNIPDHCPKAFTPLPVNDPAGGEPYFNREDVKKAINAPADVKWTPCVENGFNNPDGDSSLPSGNRQLPTVIDKMKNVIIAHGAMDYIVALNGVLLGIQNMTWGGQLGFQTAPSDPFYVPKYGFDPLKNRKGEGDYFAKSLPAGFGVQGTTHTERGLTLAVAALAGHQGPGYAPAASFRQLEKLLGRVDSLSNKTPFTLPQLKNIPQGDEPLGKGTVTIPCTKRGC